jgi:hypothetical protein
MHFLNHAEPALRVEVHRREREAHGEFESELYQQRLAEETKMKIRRLDVIANDG